MNPVFSGPAPGLAGDRGGDLAGAAPSGAQRSDLQAGQFAKRASLTRSVRETRPAIPGHGKGPPRVSAGIAGLTVLREGRPPVRGETPVPRWLDAQRNGPAPRSGDTPSIADFAFATCDIAVSSSMRTCCISKQTVRIYCATGSV